MESIDFAMLDMEALKREVIDNYGTVYPSATDAARRTGIRAEVIRGQMSGKIRYPVVGYYFQHRI